MIDEKVLCDFKERKIKANKIFTIREVDKNTCYEFVRRYHYLANAKFFCVYGYGLYYKDDFQGEEMVGCATFSNPQGTSALKGWFGLDNDCTDVLELSRLCLYHALTTRTQHHFFLGTA